MNKENIKLAQIENIVTITLTTITTLGLAAIFHSWHCLWGLLLMLNLNSFKTGKE